MPMSGFTDLRSCADWGVTWLREAAWPLWLRAGIDWRSGQFHEHLHPGKLNCSATFRRLRVAARQTYVFANAARYGVPEAREAVDLGLAFLRQRAHIAKGRYAWRFALDGSPTDLTTDLYDHAFVLLAYATAGPVVGVDTVRAHATEVGTFIDQALRHPNLGYEEGIPPSRPRRQNPHMHLLEASLAAHATFGGTSHLARADALVRLFLESMFQWPEGALPEFFDDALLPLRTDGRFEVEPGHHYEWVWLLDWYRDCLTSTGRAAPPKLDSAIVNLLAFADRHGVRGGDGFVVDGLRSDGMVTSASARLWPQTERIKAEARRPGDGDVRRAAVCSAVAGLAAWTDGCEPGLWHERIAADGARATEPAPASSLYHITCALVDLDRRAG
jgi:mannose/cellobiose epimerase-like protein (N-acyl-D-glucosamine 2-epimerase family)